MNILSATLRLATAVAVTGLWIGSAASAPLPGYPSNSASLFASVMRGDVPDAAIDAPAVAPSTLAPELRRQVVNYQTKLAPGTIVVDTSSTFLYLVLSDGQALRYGIGVGRDGFGWSGEQTVTRKAEWPDWTPPQEMIERQPYLPRWMAGGEGNPLGARALYLGSTVYRIHGTNAPETIGQRVSSGCIRMLNADVMDLYSRVNVGTRIVVLRGRDEAAKPALIASTQIAAPRAGAQRMPGIY
jgi:lipoprotein-anchoring transpeptidase ErfK/SrfK